MPSFSHDHGDFVYEIQGSGPRVLFLNGSGATIDLVRPLVQILAKQLTIAIHDQRGLGRTSVPDGPYTMADYARDALAFLDHLNWDTCGVLGISFGGMVAQEFAVTWPERVNRLILACTSSGGLGGSSYPLHELFDLDEEERIRRMIPLSDSRFTDEWFAERPQDRAYFTRAATTTTTESRADGTHVSEAVPSARQGAWRQLMARRDHDVWDRLPRIQCPTLVMSGRYDGIAPPENGTAITSQVSGAEQRIYDGGHQFFIQDQRALPEMSNFLSGPPTTRDSGAL